MARKVCSPYRSYGKGDWQQLLIVLIDHSDSSVNVLVGLAWVLSLGKTGFNDC